MRSHQDSVSIFALITTHHHRRQTFTPLFMIFISLLLLGQCEDFRPNCGFPGKPYLAKILPVEKAAYSEGDVVTYQCHDYWAPPQPRRCTGGQWTGPIARCANFVPDVVVRDCECFDLTTRSKIPVLRYANMTLVETEWKLPNSFLAKSFGGGGKLVLHNDHEYLWKFNLSRPSVKLYVKVNIHFINFTVLPDAIRRSHRFSLNVTISKHRTCVLQHQTLNIWLGTGNRIDSYFLCESHSPQDAKDELKNPPSFLEVHTRSSLNLTYEFSALFFGKVYGTEQSPICGEPETVYGQILKVNRQYRDYVSECADPNEWREVLSNDARKGIPHILRCLDDMRWNGSRPLCLPTRYCAMDGAAFDKLKHALDADVNNTLLPASSAGPPRKVSPAGPPASYKMSSKQKKKPKSGVQHLAIDTFVNYLLTANNTIYATIGSEITFACDSDEFILVGRENRKCRPDGKWSGSEPTCKSLTSSQFVVVIVGLVALLVILLAISGCVFYTYTQRMKKRVKQAQRDGAEAALHNEYNLINKLDSDGGEGIYELYNRIDDPVDNVYTDTGYLPSSCGMPQYANHQAVASHIGQEQDDDYVQMFRRQNTQEMNTDAYESLVSVQFDAKPPKSRPPVRPTVEETDDPYYVDVRRNH